MYQVERKESKTVTVIHNKLVRDNIPDIIRQNGSECETKTVTGAEYKEALRQKLQGSSNFMVVTR